MKKSIALGLALAATMVGSLTTSGTALAAVVPFTTVTSGASCHNYFPGEDVYFYHDESIYNSTGSNHWVSCPLVVSHTTGVTLGNVKLRFGFVSPNIALTCSLYGIRADGTTLYSSTKTGILGLVEFKNVAVGPLVAYTAQCNLPGGFSIFALQSTF